MSVPSSALWVVVDRGGAETVCANRADWLAEWGYRVRCIEEADRPAALRRDGLERLLTSNAGVYLSLARAGHFDAACIVTQMVAAADSRLSRLIEMREVTV